MTTPTNFRLTVLLVATSLVFVGCASSGGASTGASQVDQVSLPDKTFQVSGGNLTLRNLRVGYQRGEYIPTFGGLNGEIVDDTDRTWSAVSFELFLIGPSGEELGSSMVVLLPQPRSQESLFHAGPVHSFDELASFSTTRIENPNEYNFEIRNFDATYPVDYDFAMTEPEESQSLSFQDDAVAIEFDISEERIAFNLENKSSQPIQIDWNQVSYVDPDGSSNKVMHKGVKYANKDESLAPTTVPPNASIEDFILPTDLLVRTSDGWTEGSLFPDGSESEAYDGQTFSLFMPLEIGEETQNYNFTFEVADVSFVSNE